ncbi:hypothetical protein [Mesorhizobium sp. LjNodule214]|uniref:hypothetical protein n=1 Tax=Mesorhizobium sp. LjNodule214 TaxID=3342252 RepID=UPI003ECE23B8
MRRETTDREETRPKLKPREDFETSALEERKRAQAAERQRRKRRAKGIVAPHVPFHRQDTTCALVEAGLLPEWDSENIDAIVEALAKAIDLMNKRHA